MTTLPDISPSAQEDKSASNLRSNPALRNITSRGKSGPALDLLSISQQLGEEIVLNSTSPELQREIESELEQSKGVQAERCERGAPFIFYVDATERPRIVQGCCNAWDCPRCGQIRARHEYGRIVHGSRELVAGGNELYFWTLTCRGRDMPLETALNNYLAWTNKLLTYLRRDCRKEGGFWAYTQITERQKRLHPHSHIISTYCPSDAILTTQSVKDKQLKRLVSARFATLNERSGLGSQHIIRPVDRPEGAAVYVSKYLFKDSMTTRWPKKWRRVRYSRSWPKLPEQHPEIAWPLIRPADWQRVRHGFSVVYADSEITKQAAEIWQIDCIVPEESYSSQTRK